MARSWQEREEDSSSDSSADAEHARSRSTYVLPSRRGIELTKDPSGAQAAELMEVLAEEGMIIQRQKLKEILTRNAGVEYLQRHGLGGRTDVESFRQCIPVVSYEDLEPDLMRLVNGDKSPILTADPIINFIISSGTTAGRPKYFPSTEVFYESEKLYSEIRQMLSYRYFPDFRGGKTFTLLSAGEHSKTPSGIVGGSVSTVYCRSDRFQKRVRDPKTEFSSPDAVILCHDVSQGMYCHLVCALAQSPAIVKLFGYFAGSIVGAIRALQKQWREVIEDIRTGTLNPKITEPELRSEVETKVLMNPNPELAAKLEMECLKEETWENIIPRLFPNARLIECIISGSMYQYAPALKKFAGHVPIASLSYGTSEANHMGISPNGNCAIEDVSYMLWPEAAYFEFIPLENGEDMDQGDAQGDQLKVLEACDLEVGKDYELLLTTVTGLYRYRVCDVLRVLYFKRNFPIFKFLRRQNVVLSVSVDKTDEAEILAVIVKACKLLKGTSMELFDYTCAVDLATLPGHYIIYWELVNSRNLDEDVLQNCTNIMEASLSNVYREGREDNLIGPIELRVIKEGTFEDLKALAVKGGVSPAQFKLPRSISNPQRLQLLNDKTLVSFRSTAAIVRPSRSRIQQLTSFNKHL